MARVISVYRRRPHLVDLYVQTDPTVAGYSFAAGANFDAAAVEFQQIPITGFASKSVPTNMDFDIAQFRGMTRFRFDPADYSNTVHAVTDFAAFYIKIAPINAAGSVGTYSSYHMILPYDSQPQRAIILNGTAPNGSNIGNSLELQLPMQCNNWEMQVNGTHPVFVAFTPTGAEWQANPVATAYTNFGKVYSTISQIFVRSGVGTSTFNMILTERNNPVT